MLDTTLKIKICLKSKKIQQKSILQRKKRNFRDLFINQPKIIIKNFIYNKIFLKMFKNKLKSMQKKNKNCLMIF